MFDQKFILWFHKVNDEKWGLDSYIKISKIKELDDLLYITIPQDRDDRDFCEDFYGKNLTDFYWILL